MHGDGNTGELGIGSGDGHAGTEAREDNQGSGIARCQRAAAVFEIVDKGVVGAEGRVELGADEGGGAGETFPGDADDGEQSPVEAERAAEHCGVGTVALPEGIADNHHGSGAAGAFLIGGKDTAAEQRGADDVEVVRGDRVGEQAARGVAFGEAHHREIVRRKAGENSGLAAQIDVVGVGEGAVVIGLAGVAAVEADELVGLADGERLQQEGVHEAENRGIGADTQGEHEHGGGGEGRFPGEHPDAVREIVHRIHLEPGPTFRLPEKFTKMLFGLSKP